MLKKIAKDILNLFSAIDRRDLWIMGTLIIVGTAIRILFLTAVFPDDLFSQPLVDSENYHQWAQSILGGDIIGKDVYVHSPFYPFLIALIYKIAGIKPIAVIILQYLMGIGACIIMYVSGKKFFGRAAGTVSGAIGAFYGPGLFFESTLLSVALIHLLNCLVIVTAYWAMRRRKYWPWAIPGALLGLSVLTRPNIILLAPMLILWMIVMRPRIAWREIILRSIVLSAAMLAVISPATIRNAVVLKEFMLSVGHGGVNFYLGNAQESTGFHKPLHQLGISAKKQIPRFRERAEQITGRKMNYSDSSRFWFWQAWREISADPDHWQRIMLNKVFLFFNQYEYTTSLNYIAMRQRIPVLRWPWLSFMIVAPLGLLGMLWSLRRWRELFPWYGLFAVVFLTNIGMLVSAEYRFAAMPSLYLFSGMAVLTFAQRIKQKDFQSLLLPAAALAVFVLISNIPILNQEDKNYHLATAHNNFGNRMMKQGDYMSAAQEFQNALDYLPDNPRLLLLHADALYKIGMYTESMQSIESAYRQVQDDDEILTLYANVLTALGQYPLAIEKRKAAIRFDERNPNLYFNLAVTYFWAGQEELGDVALRDAVTLDPSMEEACYTMRENILSKKNGMRENESLADAESNTSTPEAWRVPQMQYQQQQYQQQYQQYQQYQNYQQYQQQYQPPPVQYR